MKKKISILLLVLLARVSIYANIVTDTPSLPLGLDQQDEKPLEANQDFESGQTSQDEPPHIQDPQDLQATESEQDTFLLPPIGNYISFLAQPLKLDYLYNTDSTKSIGFDHMKPINWPSLLRANFSLLYAIRINQSRFAFCVGVGRSTLEYAFRPDKVAGATAYKTLKKKAEKETECIDLKDKPGRELLGSTINIPFWDIIFRLRYNTVLHAPKEGFNAWLGCKFGMRTSASTTIAYKEYNNKGAYKTSSGDFDLDSSSFELQLGLGYHRFGLMGGLQLTPLFKQNQGPSNANLLKPFSFSIYIDLV